MALKGVLLAVGCLAGFACAYVLAGAFARWMRTARARQASRAALSGGRGSRGGLWARGIPALLPAARLLLRFAPFGRAAEALRTVVESRGIACTAESSATLLVLSIAVVGAVGVAAAASPLGGLAADALVLAAVFLAARSRREREAEAARDGVPQALNVMGECFQSGYTLVQTMDQVADQADGLLAPLFAQCADTLRMGGTSREALSCLRGDARVPELSFVAVALDVQHQSGGSVTSVLGSAQRMVADEIELRRSMRVQTAQARLSARVVCLMPFVLVAVLSLMSDGFLDAFFGSAAGMAMLVVALAMEAAGVLLVRKMLEVAQ